MFGVPVQRLEDPLGAARAAIALRDGVDALNTELRHAVGRSIGVRIGVEVGPAVDVPDGHDGGRLVSGATLALTTRLEQSAPVGAVVVGPELVAELGRHIVTDATVDLVVDRWGDEPGAARRLLCPGPRDDALWYWVDPARPPVTTGKEPGIPPRTLARLIDRLEQL